MRIGNDRRQDDFEINVISLIDVLLTLLMFFVLTTTFIQHSRMQVTLPKASMFVWAPIPGAYRHLGSLEFSTRLLKEAKVAVSPGIGFGEYGDGHVRFSLIENEERTRQALRGIRQMFQKDGVGLLTAAR